MKTASAAFPWEIPERTKMNRKGAELSLNVIIIAVIVIIVLVVLVIIFSGRTQIFTRTTHETSEPYESNVCDVPGTGRFCASNCATYDGYEVKVDNHICRDITRGTAMCCCCKFDLPSGNAETT